MRLSLVAKRYAQAILNVYGSEFVFEDVAAMRDIRSYLQSHRRIVFLLRLAVVPDEVKERGLCMLCERFKVSVPCRKLVGLLRAHRRLQLFPAVLEYLERLYLERKRIVPIAVSSASALSESDQKVIEQFFAQQLGVSVVGEYQIDQSLIAGLRVQSQYYLWERSVAKQLRDVCSALSR